MLRRTLCMMGREASELFYDAERFMRHGAAPGRIQKTLFGKGGVQGLDDAAHQHRKAMFMSLMESERIRQLVDMTIACLGERLEVWSRMERFILYDELHEVLTRAACNWAGVPLRESEVERRTRELMALFQCAGSVGPKHWWARLQRKKANHWTEGVVGQIRTDQLDPPPNTAAHVIAHHRDLEGQLLTPHIAAVELLNVLRPIVAVSVYLVFVAHALHEHPVSREFVTAGDECVEQFVQEVRRFYPFFSSRSGPRAI